MVSSAIPKEASSTLVRATRLLDVQPWPRGLSAVDRLSRIGGLPRGRVTVLQGPPGSGKLSLGLDLLASATREFSQAVVLHLHGGFDPWTLQPRNPDLSTLIVVHPPNPSAAGETAVALARAGTTFLLVLDALPESALAPLESAAPHSSCAVVTIDQGSDRGLAHASSLTLGFERTCWGWDRDLLVGLRTRLACRKNRLAAPGSATELEVRYGLGATLGRTGQGGEREARGGYSGAAAMAGPVCCGLIPHLELAVHPELYGQPVVVARFGDRVITASQEAVAHGVLAGMTVRQAEALSPAVAVVEPQIEAVEGRQKSIGSRAARS